MRFYRKALMLSSLVLLSSLALLALVLVPTHTPPVHASTVIRLTDVPGRWFSCAIRLPDVDLAAAMDNAPAPATPFSQARLSKLVC